MKSIGYLIVFLFLSVNSQAQQISFTSILDGVNKPVLDSFQKELKDNKFIMVSPYKNRLKPEIWAYNYDPNNNRAQSWVHYSFDKSVYEKKKKKTATVEITFTTFGSDNQFHAYLLKLIKENCRFAGTFTDDYEGYFYDEYFHSSGADFKIYSNIEEYYIKVHNTIKIVIEDLE